MATAQMKKKDTTKIVQKLEDVIIEHRSYFASWRSNKWAEFERSMQKREKIKVEKKS